MPWSTEDPSISDQPELVCLSVRQEASLDRPLDAEAEADEPSLSPPGVWMQRFSSSLLSFSPSYLSVGLSVRRRPEMFRRREVRLISVLGPTQSFLSH